MTTYKKINMGNGEFFLNRSPRTSQGAVRRLPMVRDNWQRQSYSQARRKKEINPGKLFRELPRVFFRLGRLLVMGLAGFAVLVTVSVLFVGGYLYLSKSDYFAITDIRINAMSRLTTEEILAVTGLNRPTNNLSFDTEAAIRNIMTLDWVESVKMVRKLPNVLKIEVTEYQPKALASLDQLYYLDAQGRPFKKLEPGEKTNFPVISGFTLDDLINQGPLVKEALAGIFELINILAERNDEFTLENISELNYDPDRGVTVYTRHTGIQLKVGFGVYAEKFRRLGRVVAHLKLKGQLNGLIYMNLESPPRITVRYGPDGQPESRDT